MGFLGGIVSVCHSGTPPLPQWQTCPCHNGTPLLPQWRTPYSAHDLERPRGFLESLFATMAHPFGQLAACFLLQGREPRVVLGLRDLFVE
jgi:hypothetical protein